MKRSGWLAIGLSLAALALPGCYGPFSPEPPAGKSAPAAPEQASREQDRRKTANKDAEAALFKEEGHPFWNVVGAGLGLIASLGVIVLMMGA